MPPIRSSKISTLYQATPLFPPRKRVPFKNSTTISPCTRPYLRCTQQNAIFLPIHGTFSRALYILVISCRSRTVVPCIHRRISPPRCTPGLSLADEFIASETERGTSRSTVWKASDSRKRRGEEEEEEEEEGSLLARDAESHLEFMRYVRLERSRSFYRGEMRGVGVGKILEEKGWWGRGWVGPRWHSHFGENLQAVPSRASHSQTWCRPTMQIVFVVNVSLM